MDFARRLEPQRFQRKQPDGTTLEIRRNPLPQGGFVTPYTDISDLKRREEALAASEQRYALVLKGVNKGRGEWWDDTNEVTVSTRVKEKYDISDARSGIPLSEWPAHESAEDYPTVRRDMGAYLRGER